METVFPVVRPDDFFEFLDAVKKLGCCKKEDVRAHMRAQWPVVTGARSFAVAHELITDYIDDSFELTDLGMRVMRYSGQKRRDFVVRNWRLQDKEPFKYVREYIFERKEVDCRELLDIALVKFGPRKRLEKGKRAEMASFLEAWLSYFGLVEVVSSGRVKDIQGEVHTPGVVALLELEVLRERELRDRFAAEYGTQKDLATRSRDLLDAISSETDEKKREVLFGEFVRQSFGVLGFSYRNKNSLFHKDSGLTFEHNQGGGDFVLFYHHPLDSKSEVYEGGAIACELKSTEHGIGSRAIGQARNLCKTVAGEFSKYVVMTVVISRSKTGFDPSGRNIAPPEVVHLTDKSILEMLELQRKRASGEGRLLLPSDVFVLLDGLVRDEVNEPDPKEIAERLTSG